MLDFVKNLGDLKATGDELQRNFSPKWIVDTIASGAAAFIFKKAMEAGPPPFFAERLKMDPEKARVLYGLVLKAALDRAEGS